VRYLRLGLLSLVVWAFSDVLNVLNDDKVKVVIHEVALLVPQQVNILLGSDDSLVVLILAPFLKVKDQISREVDGVIELCPEVKLVAAAVYHESVAYTHGVDQSPPQLLYGFVFCDPSEADAELQLVQLHHVSLVAEEDLALPCRIEDQLVLLAIFQA